MTRVFCAALLISAMGTARAQEFEVASVKASAPPTVDPHIVAMRTPPDPPGRFTRKDIPLSTLIVMAYGLKHYEYAGPSWLASARFDITAKAPAGATQTQEMAMLQNLLPERFGLKVHREKREMTVYELAIAKGGPRVKQAVPAPPPGAPKITFDADGVPVLAPGGGVISGLPGRDGIQSLWGVLHEEITMERLASILGSLIGGRRVTDATGLKGKYDVAMHWAIPAGPPDNDASGLPLDAAAIPAIFAALESQLGLKLESKKGTVRVLGVDHCEKTPTEN